MMNFKRGDLVRWNFQQVLANREDTEVHLVIATRRVADSPLGDDGFSTVYEADVMDVHGNVRCIDTVDLRRVQ